VGEEGQPGGTCGAAVAGPEVLGEHATNDILVDRDAEGMREPLGDAHTAEGRIALLHLNDGRDELWRGTFGAWFTSTPTRRKELTILPINQGLVELEQRCWLDQRAKLPYPLRVHEQRSQSEHEAIEGRGIRRPLPATIADEKLVLQ
jgi:hypothetical protein